MSLHAFNLFIRKASKQPKRFIQSSAVRIVEVGPRDGLQNESLFVPTDKKIEFINRLSETGLKTIEVTSFVSAKWVPQMSDNTEVFQGINKNPAISYPVLVPNVKGLQTALKVGAKEIAVFASASDGFSRKNVNCSAEEGISKIRDVIDIATGNKLKIRGYVSCVVGCPYDGHIAPSKVAKVAEKLLELGCYEISLGDTIGVGTRTKIKNMLKEVFKTASPEKIAIHCHDTYGQALVNICESLDAGISVIDSSVSGLGGCPYAKGASGNVATEDLVYMLEGMGIDTGVDLEKLILTGNEYVCTFEVKTYEFDRFIMRINATRMTTPIEEKVDQKLKVRTGIVAVSDGKSRPVPVRLHLSMEVLRLQKEEVVPPETKPLNAKERMVQIRRQKVGGLGLSIKGGAEHKLPILISRIYKNQAADQTGELFVGDAIIKVNGEYITACPHDDAVNILRNAGDLVVLTVKHYRAATPFLQKQEEKESQQTDSNSDEKETSDESLKVATNSTSSRPSSLCSESEPELQTRWVDIVTLPLMMAYVTRYIFGTDKLRPNAFEVRGLNGVSTGIIHCDDSAILSQWLKYITDNIIGLTHLQMKLYNRNFSISDRIEYMGWVNEGVLNNNQPWQNYKPRFFALKGADLMLFDTPPLNVQDWGKCPLMFKVYQTMFRIVKESENVDERQHCFLVQTSGQDSRYFSVETRQELLRIENAWHCAVCTAVMKLGNKTFTVSCNGKTAGLTLDWNLGFSLHEGDSKTPLWQYKFSQLRGSSDDGKSKLKLHFQDPESRAIETKELECSILQSLLFCMHAFLTAKVASVDPGFLCSMIP